MDIKTTQPTDGYIKANQKLTVVLNDISTVGAYYPQMVPILYQLVEVIQNSLVEIDKEIQLRQFRPTSELDQIFLLEKFNKTLTDPGNYRLEVKSYITKQYDKNNVLLGEWGATRRYHLANRRPSYGQYTVNGQSNPVHWFASEFDDKTIMIREVLENGIVNTVTESLQEAEPLNMSAIEIARILDGARSIPATDAEQAHGYWADRKLCYQFKPLTSQELRYHYQYSSYGVSVKITEFDKSINFLSFTRPCIDGREFYDLAIMTPFGNEPGYSLISFRKHGNNQEYVKIYDNLSDEIVPVYHKKVFENILGNYVHFEYPTLFHHQGADQEFHLNKLDRFIKKLPHFTSAISRADAKNQVEQGELITFTFADINAMMYDGNVVMRVESCTIHGNWDQAYETLNLGEVTFKAEPVGEVSNITIDEIE